MVVGRIFFQLFLKVGSAELFAKQGELHIPQGYRIFIKSGNFVFIRPDIDHIILVKEIIYRVQLH